MGDGFSKIKPNTPDHIKRSRICVDSMCAGRPAHYTTGMCSGVRVDKFREPPCNHPVCEYALSQCACVKKRLCGHCFSRRAQYYFEGSGIYRRYDPTFETFKCPKCPPRLHISYQSFITDAQLCEADGISPKNRLESVILPLDNTPGLGAQ